MSESRTLTQDELVEECKKRFGDDPKNWAFQCPQCKDIAVSADFTPFANSGYGSELLGQECIGRYLGARSKAYKSNEDYRKQGGRGCDWAAFGFFKGPWFIKVIDDKGEREIPCFALAEGIAQ